MYQIVLDASSCLAAPLVLLNPQNVSPNIQIRGAQTYSCEMSDASTYNVTRMANRLEKLETYLQTDQSALENTENQLEQAKAMQFQPFPQEQELAEKTARLAELTQELSLDKKDKGQQQAEPEPDAGETVVSDKAPRRLSDLLRDAKNAIMGRNAAAPVRNDMEL